MTLNVSLKIISVRVVGLARNRMDGAGDERPPFTIEDPDGLELRQVPLRIEEPAVDRSFGSPDRGILAVSEDIVRFGQGVIDRL